MNKFDVLKFMQKPVKNFLYLQFKQKNNFRNNYSRKITAAVFWLCRELPLAKARSFQLLRNLPLIFTDNWSYNFSIGVIGSPCR